MLTATLFVLLGEAAARPIALPQLRRPGLGAGNACASYEIVSARGTTESQTNPIGVARFAAKVTQAVPGGTKYEAVYPASFATIAVGPSLAARDMIKHLDQQAQTCPNQPFMLFGYSQGAEAIVTLMNEPGFQKHAKNMAGAVLYGNPYWTLSNAGISNAGTARTGRGTFGNQKSVPEAMKSITKDYCNARDLFCTGGPSLATHLGYAGSPQGPQSINFAIERLQAVVNKGVQQARTAAA